jgi:hypothetical protein
MRLFSFFSSRPASVEIVRDTIVGALRFVVCGDMGCGQLRGTCRAIALVPPPER